MPESTESQQQQRDLMLGHLREITENPLDRKQLASRLAEKTRDQHGKPANDSQPKELVEPPSSERQRMLDHLREITENPLDRKQLALEPDQISVSESKPAGSTTEPYLENPTKPEQPVRPVETTIVPEKIQNKQPKIIDCIARGKFGTDSFETHGVTFSEQGWANRESFKDVPTIDNLTIKGDFAIFITPSQDTDRVRITVGKVVQTKDSALRQGLNQLTIELYDPERNIDHNQIAQSLLKYIDDSALTHKKILEQVKLLDLEKLTVEDDASSDIDTLLDRVNQKKNRIPGKQVVYFEDFSPDEQKRIIQSIKRKINVESLKEIAFIGGGTRNQDGPKYQGVNNPKLEYVFVFKTTGLSDSREPSFSTDQAKTAYITKGSDGIITARRID